MSEDHMEFLKNKFMQDLQGAEEQRTGDNKIPLHPYFLQIRDVLQDKKITPPTLIRLKINCLHEVISVLEDCVILSEKRESRNKDGPFHGHSPAELWLLCKSRRQLLQIKKKLHAASEDAADSSLPSTSNGTAASSSSTSLPAASQQQEWLNFRPRRFHGFDDQVKEIKCRLLDENKCCKGLQKVGIVGIGGSGKTTLAKLVFTNSKVEIFFNYRIWISLFQTVITANICLKEIVKNMLQQCNENTNDRDHTLDELLGMLTNLLKGEKYLIVFDGIWSINFDWYFALGEKLDWFNEVGESESGLIITTRLPRLAKQMVGSKHLHHMQPVSEDILWSYIIKWESRYFREIDSHSILSKMVDEIAKQCHGLPLAGKILGEVIPKQILGEGYDIIYKYQVIALVNPEDDAILGNSLLASFRTLSSAPENLVFDMSKNSPQDVLNQVDRRTSGLERHHFNVKEKLKILVASGDAAANRILQLVNNFKIVPKPPIALMPLGSETNFSLSLGWGNRSPNTDLMYVVSFLKEVFAAQEKNIDSWDFKMRMRMIPKGLLDAFSQLGAPETDSIHMGVDKEFRTTFWNYFVIGMHDQERFKSSSYQKKHDSIAACCFKSWPRMSVLPISIKMEDQQGQWQEIRLQHSIKSIACLNLPCFPGGVHPWEQLNLKNKGDRNFTPSFVDDGLLEVIGLRDSWHGGETCLAQAGRIRFEIHKAASNHIHMSIDGKRWKQPLPVDDDSFEIEITHLSATNLLVTSDSKCKFKMEEGPGDV